MTRDGNAIGRRELLRRLAAGVLAVHVPALPRGPRLGAAFDGGPPPAARRKKLILLWLEGGASQIDTFDPKPGAATNGPFKALPTDVDGWRMSEHLPGLAKRAGQLAVIRSLVSKEGSHQRARELLHCGYPPTAGLALPTLGAIVAHEVGDLDQDLPAFVQIGGPLGSPGYLGARCSPFRLRHAQDGDNLTAAARRGDDDRIARRGALCDALDAGFAERGALLEVSHDREQRRRAERLRKLERAKVFDLSHEADSVRDAYGRNPFGSAVLLARRLVEAGASAIEVVSDGWDTHVDNFTQTRALCATLDPAFSALIDDLERRGLLADTLVLCMGEFGRSPVINSRDGRDHWPSNQCVALAGCGIRPGTVVGATDERGENVVERPVRVADLFATVAALLGIDGGRTFHATSDRPVTLVDPAGVVVRELIA